MSLSTRSNATAAASPATSLITTNTTTTNNNDVVIHRMLRDFTWRLNNGKDHLIAPPATLHQATLALSDPETIQNPWIRALMPQIPLQDLALYLARPRLLLNHTPMPSIIMDNIISMFAGIWGFRHEITQQLSADLRQYIESFSGPARQILYDQMWTYVGRTTEDMEDGTHVFGRYAREFGLWVERLRMRDVKGVYKWENGQFDNWHLDYNVTFE